MDLSAYRILYDNIHDFKTTAAHIESEIKRLGIHDKSHDAVPAVQGRTQHDMWVSMKTVSHFNLGISLELLLKLLIFLNNKSIPHHHFLAELLDDLPDKHQKQLESTYQASRSVLPDGYSLIAFFNSASPQLPSSSLPPIPQIGTLREFFEYFDKDVMLWQKRYSWELIEKEQYRHYLSDMSVFVEFINRVMGDIPRSPIPSSEN